MAKGARAEFKPVVVTANDLSEGDSVFLAADGWVRDVALAKVARSEEEAMALDNEAAAAVKANLVVGPYRVEVSLDTGAPEPVLRRERIRASGLPTIAFGAAQERERRAA